MATGDRAEGGVGESSEQSLGPNEMYCSECGEVVLRRASICPSCGVAIGEEAPDTEDKNTLGAMGYAAIGGLSGFISFILVPIVFGPVAMFCGVQLYRKHHELGGIAVFMLGGVGMVIGALLGMLAWG